MKRVLLSLVVPGIICLTRAAGLEFPQRVKASIIFRQQTDGRSAYPHTILTYLRLENLENSDLVWLCDNVSGIEAEVLDSSGNSVGQATLVASITSKHAAYRLPYRSSLEWCISSGGMTLVGNRHVNAALMVGGRGWLLPRDSLASYSLKVRVRGTPDQSVAGPRMARDKALLFDVPTTPIELDR